MGIFGVCVVLFGPLAVGIVKLLKLEELIVGHVLPPEGFFRLFLFAHAELFILIIINSQHGSRRGGRYAFSSTMYTKKKTTPQV